MSGLISAQGVSSCCLCGFLCRLPLMPALCCRPIPVVEVVAGPLGWALHHPFVDQRASTCRLLVGRGAQTPKSGADPPVGGCACFCCSRRGVLLTHRWPNLDQGVVCVAAAALPSLGGLSAGMYFTASALMSLGVYVSVTGFLLTTGWTCYTGYVMVAVLQAL